VLPLGGESPKVIGSIGFFAPIVVEQWKIERCSFIFLSAFLSPLRLSSNNPELPLQSGRTWLYLFLPTTLYKNVGSAVIRQDIPGILEDAGQFVTLIIIL
jgi:hypothetical protein